MLMKSLWSISVGALLLLAACAPAAPSPTAAPAKPAEAKPAATAAAPAPAKPTEAPAAKPAEAKPAASPAAAAKPAEAKPATAASPAPAAKPAEAKPAASPAAAAKPQEIVVPKPAGNLSVKLGDPSVLNFAHLPTALTAERLRGQGWKVEEVNFAAVETTTEAAAKNEIQFGLGASNSSMLATQKGFNLPLVVEYTGNEWVMVATKAVTSCADLNGKRLAYHSEGAVSTAMGRNWVRATCNARPTELIISGGQNRAVAMMNNQLDATPLQLAEWINLDAQQPGKFHILVSFAEGLKDLATTTYYANGGWLDGNRPLAAAFIAELLKTNRMVTATPSLLQEAAKKHLPQMTESAIPPIVKAYLDLGMFPLNGGLTPSKVEGTVKFFTETGELQPGLAPDKAANLAVLEDALKIVGRVPDRP
jgi:ABC-type nitrate/sulfonate/bicarbonate transport system substrate-binding protein